MTGSDSSLEGETMIKIFQRKGKTECCGEAGKDITLYNTMTLPRTFYCQMSDRLPAASVKLQEHSFGVFLCPAQSGQR